MTNQVLLDMTRAVARRFKRDTPSGIDRVCDAYAAHFSAEAFAVLQLRGRMVVLDRAASARLFASLDLPTRRFRRALVSILAKLPWSAMGKRELRGAVYLNVSHTDFDLETHWASVHRRGLQSVYLLHDLIPITHPAVTTQHKTARHRGRVVGMLNHADGVIVNSHATGAELRSFADAEGFDLPRLLAAPIAGTSMPVPLRRPQHDRPVFVSVGTIEARKNHAVLLRAWSRLIDEMGEAVPRLVLAGSQGLRSKEVHSILTDDQRLKDVVEIRSGLGDAGLADLVSGARAVLLPTLAEGYGLPMVEALHMQVPVVASDLPSFREVGQGIPTLLDPTDIAAWTGMIMQFCTNGAEWQRQIDTMNRFQPPTWQTHFAALDTWLEGLSGTTRKGNCEESLPVASSAGHMADKCAAAAAKRRDLEAQC